MMVEVVQVIKNKYGIYNIYSYLFIIVLSFSLVKKALFIQSLFFGTKNPLFTFTKRGLNHETKINLGKFTIFFSIFVYDFGFNDL